MDVEQLRYYCLQFKAVEESFPFDENTLVFKVMGKIFLMVSLDEQPPRFNYKASPEAILAHREMHTAVIPGYHCNKKYWNTVSLDGSVPVPELKQWIQDSYHLIIASLPKYKQKEWQDYEDNH